MDGILGDGGGVSAGPVKITDDYLVTLPCPVLEVRTVMAYCVRRVTKIPAGELAALNGALADYEAVKGRGPKAVTAAGTIIEGYNRLNDNLGPLNGASVLDSTAFRWRRTAIVWVGVALLLAGVGAEVWAAYTNDTLLRDALGYVGPIAWGGLGAAVFQIKTMADRVCDFAFEEQRLSGTAARIFIGMVFGMLAVVAFADQAASLPKLATAFLAGLGAKAVYAAIEALVNGIAGHISGQKDPAPVP